MYVKCFLIFTLVLKCFPHILHCNLNPCDYPCGNIVYAFRVVITTNLTNVLQPQNLVQMLHNVWICFEMLSTHIHCNLNQCDLSMWKTHFTHFLLIQMTILHIYYIAISKYVIIHVEKTVYTFCVVITTNLTNVLQPQNLWVPFSNAS